MPRTPRARGRFTRKPLPPAAQVYAGALALSLDRTRPASERADANRLMRELADEMRSGERMANQCLEHRAMRALVCESIDQVTFGRQDC